MHKGIGKGMKINAVKCPALIGHLVIFSHINVVHKDSIFTIQNIN